MPLDGVQPSKAARALARDFDEDELFALIRRAWGPDAHVTERSVDTIVKRLRQKIEVNPAEPERLLTVWGVGYKFRDATPA